MKKLMTVKSVVACALVACGFAAEGFAGSNTKNVLNLKGSAQTYVTAGKRIIASNGSYTLATWLKLDKASSAGDPAIMDQAADAAYMFRFYFSKGNDQIVFVRRNGWSYADSNYSRMTAPPDGEWHFVTAVYDKENAVRRLYLDGELKAEDPDANVNTPTPSFAFAYTQWASYLRGAVAEMSVWGAALSQEKINAIMTARPIGEALNGCLAYWPFDEGDGGSSAADLMGESPMTINSSNIRVLEATDDFPDFRVVSPRFAVAHTVSYDSEGNVLTVSAVPTEPPSGTDLKVIVTAPDGTATTNAFATSVTDGTTYTTDLTTLARDTSYAVTVIAVDAFDDVTSSLQYAYTGDVAINAQDDEVTAYGGDGVFTISRADTADAIAYDLVVNYTISGTAVNGVDYKELSGTVVIPAGSSSVDVIFSQTPTVDFDEVRTAGLTLTENGYTIAPSASSAEIAKTFYSVNHEKKVLDLIGNATISSGKKIVSTAGSFSLSGWIKLDKTAMTGNGFIMGQQDNAQSVYMLFYNKSTDEIIFARRATAWGYSESHYTRVKAPDSNEWHFYTAIWDADNLKRQLYIDGELRGEGDGTGKVAPSINFTMGYNGYAGYFRGAFAEMAVWGKALSAERINAIMWARPEGDEFDGCLAYWPFDEGDGGTAVRDIATGQFPLTIGSSAAHMLEQVANFPAFDEGDPRTFHPVTINYPADKVTVTDNAKDDEKKGVKYLENSVVTFTATADSGTFVRWVGDVPVDQATSETITLTIDGPKVITPIFEFGWVYNNSTKTMSDGYWTLKASANASGEITVNGVSTNSTGGLLNLDQPIVDTNGNGSYTVVGIAKNSFCGSLHLKELWLPDTLRTIAGDWYDNGAFVNCTELTKVTPFLPPSLTGLGCYAFYGCSRLTGDLELGDKEGAFNFTLGTYHRHYFAGTAITSATLHESVTIVPFNTFDGCTKMTNVVIEGELTSIESAAFNNCKAVKSFTLEHRPDTFASAFGGWTAYQCRFLIDANDSNWHDYMTNEANFTAWGSLDQTTKDKYTAAFPGVKKPIGLSKTLPANQWLCNLKEPGMKLIFR